MKMKCNRCGSTENLTKDHIIPKYILKILCVATQNHSENLQILCKECNTLKSHALDPKHPKTMPLLRKYIDRYEELYITKRSPRNYVFKNLTVESLTPNTIYMYAADRKKELQHIYQKQKGNMVHF